ncbi:hypothetical protein V8F20_003621 [Naviculisporaceae sp. PSN 640]
MAPATPRRAFSAQLPEGVLELLRRRISPDTAIPIPVPAPRAATSVKRDGDSRGGTPVIARQAPPVQTSTIPSTYGSLYSGPQPGEVVGIVLGSVAGFIILLWLVYTCINMGNPSSSTDNVSSVVTRKSRRHRSSHHHHHAHGAARPRSATVEIRTSTRERGVPVIVDDMSSSGAPEEAIIVEETTTSRRRARSTSRGPPVRMVGSDDEVVVIEEASPSRHRSRRRSSAGHGSYTRRSSGYREVDPDRFAGGDAEMREIRRSLSRRRYD